MLFRTDSVASTQAFGERLGRLLPAGAVLGLVGDLGAGKTALSQGIARGLGVRGAVQSPTFVLVDEHEGGRLPLVHADLYRVDDASELEQLGLEERLELGDAVGLVEWADRFPQVLPTDHLRVHLKHEGPVRSIELVATGPRHAGILELLRG